MTDVRLNAIVDPERANGRSLVDLTRMVVAGGATLIQLRDKLGSDAAHGRGGARHQRGAGRDRRAAGHQRPRRCGARGRRARAFMSGRTTCASRTRAGCSATMRSSGLSIKTRRAGERGADRQARLCRASAACYATTSKDNPEAADRHLMGCAASSARISSRASPICRSVGIAGIDASNAASVMGAGRGRRRGDFGALDAGAIRRGGGARTARHRR